MGGEVEPVERYLAEHYTEGAHLEDALRLAVAALGHAESEDRVIPAGDLEVAVLDRTRSQPRKFLRLPPARLNALLGEREPATPEPQTPAETAPEAEGNGSPIAGPDSGEPPVAPPAPPAGP